MDAHTKSNYQGLYVFTTLHRRGESEKHSDVSANRD